MFLSSSPDTGAVEEGRSGQLSVACAWLEMDPENRNLDESSSKREFQRGDSNAVLRCVPVLRFDNGPLPSLVVTEFTSKFENRSWSKRILVYSSLFYFFCSSSDYSSSFLRPRFSCLSSKLFFIKKKRKSWLLFSKFMPDTYSPRFPIFHDIFVFCSASVSLLYQCDVHFYADGSFEPFPEEFDLVVASDGTNSHVSLVEDPASSKMCVHFLGSFPILETEYDHPIRLLDVSVYHSDADSESPISILMESCSPSVFRMANHEPDDVLSSLSPANDADSCEQDANVLTHATSSDCNVAMTISIRWMQLGYLNFHSAYTSHLPFSLEPGNWRSISLPSH